MRSVNIRYQRQIAIPGFGIEGQRKLVTSSALILGAGGLGSPAAMYLASAGVGRLGILDSDIVELSNLQRQIIHTEKDISRPKVESAAEKISAMNDACTVETYHIRLDESNASSIISKYDFIIDALDNFPSKLLAADISWNLGKAHSFGGIFEFQGQSMTILPKARPCLRCLFKRFPAEHKVIGPIGALPGIIGSIQALEAIKYLAGLGVGLNGKLFHIDTLGMNSGKINISPAEDCPVCGN